MSSTRNCSIATKCWRTNSMMDAIAGTSSRAAVCVVLLQILGEDGLMWSTLRWSQNDFSSVRFFQIYWERSTYFCIESTHLPSFDRWNLSASPCPSGCRLLQFDQCWVEIHEIQDLFGSDREFLRNFFLMHLFLKLWATKCCFSLPMTMAMRSPLLNDIVRNWEKIQCPSEETSAGLFFSHEMPASAVDGALIPVKKAFFALRFRVCLAQLK